MSMENKTQARTNDPSSSFRAREERPMRNLQQILRSHIKTRRTNSRSSRRSLTLIPQDDGLEVSFRLSLNREYSSENKRLKPCHSDRKPRGFEEESPVYTTRKNVWIENILGKFTFLAQ